MLKVLTLVGLVLAVSNANSIFGLPDEADEELVAPETQSRYPRDPYYDPSTDVQDEWQALLQQQQDQPSVRDIIPDQVALESESAQPAYVALQPSLNDLADYYDAERRMQLMDEQPGEFQPSVRELPLETQGTPETTPETTQTTRTTQTIQTTRATPLVNQRPENRIPCWLRRNVFERWRAMIRNRRPTSSSNPRFSPWRSRVDWLGRPRGRYFGRRPRSTTPSVPTARTLE